MLGFSFGGKNQAFFLGPAKKPQICSKNRHKNLMACTKSANGIIQAD